MHSSCWAFRRRLWSQLSGIHDAGFISDGLLFTQQSLYDVPLRSLSTTRLDFRRIDRWEGVRSLLKTQKDNVQVIDIVSALNALKLSKVTVPVSFLQEMRDLILTRISDLEAQDASNILHAFAKLKFGDASLMTAILKQIQNGHLRLCRFDNRDLSTLIYSLGYLKTWTGVQVTEAIIKDIVAMVIEEMQTPYRKDTHEAVALVNFFYGLGNLQCEASGVDALMELVFKEDVLTDLNEQLFSMFISALDELKWTLSQQQWDLLENELRKETRRKSFREQGLCNVLRRLGPMGCPSKDILKLLVEESVTPKRMKAYSSQDLANLIHTISVRDISPGLFLPKFEHRVVEASILKNYKENELCNVIYGFALSRLDWKASLFEMLSKEVIRQQRLRHYTQQGLSMLLYSFGVVKFFNLEVLQSLGQECIMPGRMVSFSNQSLSNMIYGLGRLRIDDAKLRRVAEALLEESSIEARILTFNEQGLANIIYSLAQLRMPQYLRPFVDEATKAKRLKKFTDQGLSNILQSLSWLGGKDTESIKIFMTEVIKRSRTGFSDMAMTNVLTAVVGFGNKVEQLSSAFLKLASQKETLKGQQTETLMTTLERYVRFEVRSYPIVGPVVAELTLARRLKSLTDQGLVDVLKLLYRLGLVASKGIPKVVKHLRQTNRWNTMTPVTMGDALISLCWLQYPDVQIYIDLAEALTERSRLRQLESVHVISMLQSLKPQMIPVRYTEHFIDYVCRDLRSLAGHQLVDVMQFHVNFGARNEDRVRACLNELIRPDKAVNLTLKDVALALESLLSMGLRYFYAVPKLIDMLDDPNLFMHCRVHYVAKTVICLCHLGREHKKRAMALVDKIVEPPWSKEIVEKDLTDVLKVIKEVKYEYGKLGRLLNQNRRQMHAPPETSFFLTEEDTQMVEQAGRQ